MTREDRHGIILQRLKALLGDEIAQMVAIGVNDDCFAFWVKDKSQYPKIHARITAVLPDWRYGYPKLKQATDGYDYCAIIDRKPRKLDIKRAIKDLARRRDLLASSREAACPR